jgi:hypothetical protein
LEALPGLARVFFFAATLGEEVFAVDADVFAGVSTLVPVATDAVLAARAFFAFTCVSGAR